MKINAAVIGSGIGIKHLEAINKYKKSKVSILCEKDKTKILHLKKKYPNVKVVSAENEIFQDKNINLVSIASYDNYHFSQILKCIKYNKHMIVEKPMCLTLLQLKKIIFLIKKKPKIKITSNLVLRVNSLFSTLKKKIEHKKVFYIEADYMWGRIHKLYEWRSEVENYSLTLGGGIHVIDLAMWLLNNKPISIQAWGNNLVTQNSKFKKLSFIIYILKFPNNIIVKVSANAAGQYNHFHELKIFQKGKTFIHSPKETFFFDHNNKKSIIKSNYPDKENRKKLIHNFIDNLLGHKNKQIISLKEQIDLMTVCFAADESLKNNKEINIDYL
jgi:predicted dehydrogenase